MSKSNFDSNYVPKSAMAIFAHPDDAEVNAGGTIAKWAKAGCEITLVICTTGNIGTHDPKFTRESLARARAAEQKEVAKLLGAKHFVILNHDDGTLQPTLELRRELVRELRKYKPEVVICGDPAGWFYGSDYINHPDHRAAAAAALEAVFPSSEMELLWPEEGPAHKVQAVYVRGNDQPNTWIDISAAIEIKIAALKAHHSQMGDFDPGDWLREWGRGDARDARKHLKKKKKGESVGKGKLKYAEIFRVMKLVEDEETSE
jgi:LmbE family N-acetylglucosaminyl deacetylase